MKKIFLISMLLCLFIASCSNSNNSIFSENGSTSTKPNDSSITKPDLPGNYDTNESKNNLIVYFSYSGNTEDVANAIHDNLGSDIVKITPEIPYTATDVDYTNSSSRSQIERSTGPEISSITYNAYNLSDYQNILIGYPIWNGYSPMIIKMYFEHERDSLGIKSGNPRLIICRDENAIFSKKSMKNINYSLFFYTFSQTICF